jgi:hypothetical protein
MAIDFPGSPSVNDTFTSGSLVYTFDGTKWTAEPAGVTGGTKIEVSNTKAEIIDTGTDGRFVVTTEGSERLRVTSTGLMGLGTASPDALLTVSGVGAFGAGAAGTPSIARSSDLDTGFWFPAANTLAASTGGSERLRVDSSGRLLVGTSTARSVGLDGGFASGGGSITVETDAGNFSLIRNRNDLIGPYFRFGKSRGSIGSNTVVSSGDSLGEIQFCGADGSDLNSVAASISAAVDAAPGNNDMPGRLVFSTTADGASSPTERMRITSGSANGANVFFNCTSPPSSSVKGLSIGPSGGSGNYIQNSITTTSLASHFLFINSNGTVGSITTSGSATAYNTSSDYRLKENVVLLTGAIDRLQQIPVHRFNFIADPDKTVDGFLAHEAQEIVPECVTGTKDETKLVSAVLATDGSLLAQGVTETEWESGKIEDEEGDSRFPSDSQWVNEYEVPVYQGIDQSKLVPLLTAALQEAIAKIETLEAKVTALESQQPQ